MNTINPQGTLQGVQRSETRGGERTDATASPASGSGKDVPAAATSGLAAAQAAVESNATSSKELPNAVAKLNDYIQTVQRDLQFSLDETSGESVISVVDRQSAKVIRQIPAEVVLTLAQKLNIEEPLSLFSAQV